mgnify:CR=1 FL=1
MQTIFPRAIIKTKFIGPTNTRGARIKATCQAGSVTIAYPYDLSSADVHWAAAKALIEKLGLMWGSQFTVGSDNDGYYFIPADAFNTAHLEG